LASGINGHFSNVNPETESDDRFFVHLKDFGSSTYIIVDEGLGLRLELEQSTLNEPSFNLIE
jgi:hypothetical protein